MSTDKPTGSQPAKSSRQAQREAVRAAKDRAKQMEVDAKAARKAEKQRRKNSTDPRDMGQLQQIKQAYKLTHEHDPKLPWLMLAAFLLPAVVMLLIGLAIDRPILLTVMGLMIGLPLAMIMLVNRTKKATYTRYAGQAGSAEVALSMLGKKWVTQSAITANKHYDAVHRAVGPAGIVLVGEGEAGRVRQLLAAESRKHQKVAYGVEVTQVVMGDKQGQVPLKNLSDHIKKLPKRLESHQVTEVASRLKALDAVRPRMPIPKGPVPTSTKGMRQGMRGR